MARTRKALPAKVDAAHLNAGVLDKPYNGRATAVGLGIDPRHGRNRI